MASKESEEDRKSSNKLSCKGRACSTCGKCQDWHFTGDLATWEWIRHYANWSNEDWKRWRRNSMWTLFKSNEHATCTSVSHGSGSTYDDPIFGGHNITHAVKVDDFLDIHMTHDFLFIGHHIPADHRIVSSTGNLCVCNAHEK